MSNGVLGTGVSALLAFQRALATTSNNVANVNTEGYTRQRVELGTRAPEFAGFGYIGRGVEGKSIERVYSEVLVEEIRNTTASGGHQSVLYSLASQLDNLVADPDAGISPALQGFFDSVNDVADDPSSTPARQVLISQAQALVDRFDHFSQRFTSLHKNVNDQLTASLDDINSLTQAIADLNEDIVAATGVANGAKPNDLLDQRDLLLRSLAEHVAVSVVEEDDGSINVFVGKGQLIVNRYDSQQLSLIPNEFNPTRLEVALNQNNAQVEISNLLTGGAVGGALDFRNNVLQPAENALGRIAISLSSDFNSQHTLGLDLKGRLGQAFFQVPSPTLSHGATNTGNANLSMTISDPSQLTLSDYRLTYDGADQYTLQRLTDGQTFNFSVPVGNTSVDVDGFNFTITNSPAAGDTFLLQPTNRGAETLDVLISDVTRIAAASPVRSSASLNNTGSGVIAPASIMSATAYVPDNYQVTFSDATTTAVGVGVGVPVEDGAGATADDLQYELMINGVRVHFENTTGGSPAPLANLDALAATINGFNAQTGVRAYVDNTAGQLYLANDPPTALPITVTENLTAINGTNLEGADAVTGYFGLGPTAASPSASVTLSGDADSYVVLDSSSNVVTSGAYTTGNAIQFNGIQTSVEGVTNLGDQFDLSQNISGVGDNANALALARLRLLGTIDNGASSYQEAYSQMVASVGSTTRQAELSQAAQEALLRSAEGSRDALSGVNLDEEAANLLRYQQAYQAAARVISTADTLFQSLLSAVRGG